jgi:O-antigen ligase
MSWYYTGVQYSINSPKNFLIGCGTGDYHTCIANFIQKQPKDKQAKMQAPDQNPHNEYLFFLLQSGIFGLLAFLFFIYSLIRDTRGLNQIDKISAILIIITLCIGCMFNSFILDLRMGPIFLFILSILLSKPNTIKSY